LLIYEVALVHNGLSLLYTIIEWVQFHLVFH
jgi:hypothetical protein